MLEKYKKETLKILKRIKWPLFVTGMILFIGLVGYATILYGGKLVVDEEAFILDVTTTIETKEGQVIDTLYQENRELTSIDQVPTHVKDAFITVEDVRFYQHAGVDFKSVVRAISRDIIAFDKVEGASTITQQLAKNLFLYNDKTWMRKTKEVMAAIYLEREYSKDKILELYLNKIYFGHGLYGIETAAQYFFSKSVEDLSIAEGALLAGLAKSPNGYSPINNKEKSLERRNLVLQVMGKEKKITKEEQLREQGKDIGLNLATKEEKPWLDSYIDLVTKEAAKEYQLSMQELKRGGYRIVVNIDEEIQGIAYEEFKKDVYFPGNTEGVEGSFVMMDQASGEIVAAIGGRDYQSGDLNRVTINRQPGSTMKPLAVFAPAMMKDYEAYSVIPDEEQDHDGYVAQNVDDQYDGVVSIYEALTKSKNAPAVWLLQEIGISYAKEYLAKMNMDLPDSGLAIALGGLRDGVTPLNMIEGYRAFAHEGKSIQPVTINRIYNQEGELIIESNKKEVEVFSPQVAWNITEILTHAVESGTGRHGEYSKALAGKTGSTQHPHVPGMTKDAWFVGYTPQYVTALWMGYDHSDKDHYLTGGSAYPTKLTKAILTELDQRKNLVASFDRPESVQTLPKPITLPKITNMNVKYIFGGFSIIKGKLTWEGSTDERVVYRIYEQKDGRNEQIGEVTGDKEFIIDRVSLLKSSFYYVIPYDPLTEMEGEPSTLIELSI